MSNPIVPRVTWRTKDGKYLAVDDMSDLHAYNACKLMIRRSLSCTPDIALTYVNRCNETQIRLLLKYLVLCKEEELLRNPDFVCKMWCSMSENNQSRHSILDEDGVLEYYVCHDRVRVQPLIEEFLPDFLYRLQYEHDICGIG